MRPFEYARVTQPSLAVATSMRPGATYLAGGTNLVDLMKLGVEAPDLLVDVTDLPYGQIESLADGGVRVGALVSNSELAAHPAVRARYPAVSLSLLSGASGQLRNRATVGGNLLQRTRCLYFQDITKPCNKREPGTGCSAREGAHHDLAILGASAHCIAINPSDLAVVLAMLDANVEVLGPDGPAMFPLHRLYRLPGDQPERDTALPRGTLVTGVVLPPLAMAAGSTYRKVRDRASYSFAAGSVAAAMDVVDGTVSDARLAYGAVAHMPWRAHRAERVLRGAPATVDTFRLAAEEELAYAQPLRDNAYKVPLMKNLTVAVLRSLAGEAS